MNKQLDKEHKAIIKAGNQAMDRLKLMEHCTVDWNEFSGKHVIDIGPAFGGFSDLAAYHGARHVNAYELDPAMVEKFAHVNRNFIVKGKVSIHHGDFLDKVIQPADIVLFLAVLHHIENWDYAIDKVFNICKLGGTIYMEMPILDVTTYGYKPFSKRRKIWHFVPSLDEMIFQITKRGGKIETMNEGFTYNHKRLFIKITK